MKKGTSPLRIPPRNSPRKMFLESGGSNADSMDTNARDHSFLRPPLCPIPEANYNLPINPEQDLSTPRLKSDSTMGFNPRVRLFASGSGQGLSQSVEYKFRGSNFSTPESNLADNCTGFSNIKNRFGWQEAKGISSSVTEMDFSRLSSSLAKFPSNGSSQEMRLSHESAVNFMGNSENVPGTPNEIARSLKYNMSVSSSSESLPAVPMAEIQNIAPAKSLQLESKQNFTQLHFELREDPSFWDDHNVQVVIRIRPLSGIEIASQGQSRCVRQDSAHTLTWLGHPESRFTFDLVGGEKISQEKLFKVAGLPMVENCIRGYNSCMFAYGQTGSGKTHTMLGDIEDAEQNLSVNRGMTPRVFEHLFTRICKEEHARRDEKLKFICKCSFLEIYNEQVADLLETSSTNLQMREDARKGVYVENLTEVEVKGVNDVIRLLLQGASNRKVAATNMNRASSRSHSVFTCVIESKWESQSVTHHRFGRLNLVDLAGSERQKSSGAEGERLKEATNINKSLSTLGLVIMNLVNTSNGKPQHVPYRDSKLTFLLQDSLGGNSKTIIIANVSPSNCCAMETLSTLKFAQRAKFIRNNATVNENATGDVITLKMQIQQLKEEVNHLRGKLRGLPESTQEDYYGSISLLGSPGSYALETGALASPLFGHKKAPRGRDLESALAGALKREQDTETAMKAMAAELEQLKLLVKQREEDAQCGKMMLRFREDKIKRLEAVACDKMSAEAHLLEERNMLMEELQMLRNRLDRHPEVTRFAMENIRLLEQLRRFQEFYEGGEQARMEEQIAILRDQLLEALDWKLMHEQDPSLASQKELVELEHSSTNEEIEMLHRQVDKHRREAEALRNNLSFCLEAKEKLERRVDDLMTQIDKTKSSDGIRKVVTDTSNEDSDLKEDETVMEGLSAQRELKDLVEAISAASQIEAEAQGTAIIIATEAENLRRKLKESVEDNERLIYMYEKVMQERDEIRKSEKNAWEAHEKLQEQVFFLKNHVEELQKQIEGQSYAVKNDEYTNNWPHEISLMISEEETSNIHLRKEVEDLQFKLQDTSEENERLLELYEKAMQERDNIRRMWQNCGGKGFSGDHGTDSEALAQAVPGSLETVIVEGNQKFQKHGSVSGDSEEEKEVIYLRKEFEENQMKLNDILEENERLIDIYEKAMQEKDEIRRLWQDSLKTKASSKFLANQNCGVEPQDKANEADQLESVCQSMADESTCLILSNEKSMMGKDFGISKEYAIGGFQTAVQVKQETQSIEEKLKVLQEHEHQVQNKFKEMDAKLNFCGQSLDNLNMIKEKLEIDLELVTKQSAELIFSITEKEKALQAMQLEHGQLDMRLQESLKNIDHLVHLSNVEKGKWAEKEAQLQMDKDPMMANMANWEKALLQELAFAKSKLVVAQDRVKEITQLIDSMSMLEKSYKDMQDHGQNLESLKKEMACKKEEIDTLQKYINEMQANRTRVYNKLRALKTVLSDLSASEGYWKSRESRTFAKIETLASLLKEKSGKLGDLKINKVGLEAALKKTIEMEAVAQAEVCRLKDKLQLAEKQRVDAEKTVVQLDKQAALLPELRSSAENISMHFGKAASLLEGEEERIKLFSDFKNFTEQVKEHRAIIKKLEAKLKLADSLAQQIQSEMSAESAALNEAELALQKTLSEKQMLIESQEEGRQELDSLILELQCSEFEVTSKEEELMHRQEDLQSLINRLAELEKMVIVNEQLEPAHCFLLPQVVDKLQDVHAYVQEADASLESLQIAQNGASRISERGNL